MNQRNHFVFGCWGLLCVSAIANAQQRQANREQDNAMLDKTQEEYVSAFNEHDVERLIQNWQQRCDFVLASGMMIKGRNNVRKHYEDLFVKNPEVRLKLHSESRRYFGRFVIGDGTFELSKTTQKGISAKGRYTVIQAKIRQGANQGKWRTVSLRTMVPVSPADE